MATIGMVVRADGTIPFDAGVHPAHRKAILDFAETTGSLVHEDHCRHGGDNMVCTCNPKLVPHDHSA